MTSMKTEKPCPQGEATCIAEDELQAYVDGLLPAGRTAAVEDYLGALPEERARLDAYRRQNLGLHILFNRPQFHAISAGHRCLTDRLARALFYQRVTGAAKRFTGVAAALALLAAASIWLIEAGPDHRDIRSLAFARQASEAHLMLAVDDYLGQVLADGAKGAKLYNWFSRRFETASGKIPDLRRQGFTFAGGRIIPAPDGPALQLLYHDRNMRQLTLLLGPANRAMTRGITIVQVRGLSMAFWRRGALAYSLVGGFDGALLHRLATAIDGTPDVAPPAGLPASATLPVAAPAAMRSASVTGAAASR